VCLLVQVIIGNPDLKANHNITQIIEIISEFEKYPRLRELLKLVMAEQGAKVSSSYKLRLDCCAQCLFAKSAMPVAATGPAVCCLCACMQLLQVIDQQRWQDRFCCAACMWIC
jgi:hypothetical protein